MANFSANSQSQQVQSMQGAAPRIKKLQKVFQHNSSYAALAVAEINKDQALHQAF